MRTTILTITILLFFCHFAHAHKKFKVEVKETETWRSIYTLLDEHGKKIRQLDTSMYYVSFNNDNFGYFAV